MLLIKREIPKNPSYIILPHGYFLHQLYSGRWWLTPVILVTQEAEIRRIMVRRQL
jgi:hypothetical protein